MKLNPKIGKNDLKHIKNIKVGPRRRLHSIRDPGNKTKKQNFLSDELLVIYNKPLLCAVKNYYLTCI